MFINKIKGRLNMAFTTRLSLLSKIKKGDEIGWYDFYRTYRPLILLRGGDHFLTQEEKEELVQDVLLSIFKNNSKFVYNPEKGKFRSFIRTIIDRRSFDILRKRKNIIVDTDQKFLESLPDINKSDIEKKWEGEWRKHIITQSIAELRMRLEPVTFQAFELYTLNEWAPAKVADFLDLSINSVYVAKNRAIKQLRTIIKEQEAL
jgi:RNA polymerase sigma-70 factor (ECF subfamily)